MADTTSVKIEDVVRAQALIESFLTEKIPDGNFREGTHLHDVIVRAFSYVQALVQAEATEIRARQSLLTLTDINDASADRATDDLVANWFLDRKEGTFSTGTATARTSASLGDSATVPVGTVFTYSPAVSFTLNSTVDLVVSRDNMVKETDGTGNVVGYKFYIPMIAQMQGSVGNVNAGKFQSFDNFNPYITYIDVETPFRVATDVETNEELIDRAKVAVTARDLVSVRALDTTLRNEVPDVVEVTVVGAGDAEMMRDEVTETASGVTIHVLGHVNVYNRLPLVPGQVYPGGGTATASLAVDATEITLSSDAAYQFPLARIDALTTKKVAEDAVTMTRRSSFSFVDTDLVTKYKVLLGEATSYVTELTDVLAATQYRLTYTDSLLAGSADEVVKAQFLGDAADIRTVSMDYVGVKNLVGVDTLLEDANRRVVAANVKGYAHIPVVATIAMSYYADPDAPGVFPDATAKAQLMDFINNTPTSTVLKVSDLVSSFLSDQAAYVDGVAFPVTIFYRLHSPDGDVVLFTTTDKLSVESTALLVESAAYPTATRVAQQVSDRTTRVVTFENLITFTAVT